MERYMLYVPHIETGKSQLNQQKSSNLIQKEVEERDLCGIENTGWSAPSSESEQAVLAKYRWCWKDHTSIQFFLLVSPQQKSLQFKQLGAHYLVPSQAQEEMARRVYSHTNGGEPFSRAK